MYKESTGGVGLGGGGQDGCERRIKVFVKIQKNFFFFFGGGVRSRGSGRGGVWGVRVDGRCEQRFREVKFCENSKKKKKFFFGGGGQVEGGGVRGWVGGTG